MEAIPYWKRGKMGNIMDPADLLAFISYLYLVSVSFLFSSEGPC